MHLVLGGHLWDVRYPPHVWQTDNTNVRSCCVWSSSAGDWRLLERKPWLSINRKHYRRLRCGLWLLLQRMCWRSIVARCLRTGQLPPPGMDRGNRNVLGANTDQGGAIWIYMGMLQRMLCFSLRPTSALSHRQQLMTSAMRINLLTWILLLQELSG